jgi:lipoprotein-anchoring transpeptidase ErfK/SrfK
MSVPRFKQPKRNRNPAWESMTYGVLCVALVGTVVWLCWPRRVAPITPVAPLPQKVVAPVPAQTLSLPEVKPTGARPVETILEAQIALAREGISCGSIDGVAGSQTRSALLAFQMKKGIPQTGRLDADTRAVLTISPPVVTNYVVTSEDLARLLPVSTTWLGKSSQPRLDFETILELLAEKAFSHPQLIRSLNPNVIWNQVISGTVVVLPNVNYPTANDKAAFVKISLQNCVLEAFDSESNLLVHFPCSIGRVAAKRPAGELHVANLAVNPNYTFDPAVFPESAEAQSIGHKLIIPPGPNNPVGVAWIGLDRPGYGIHGTPSPEKVGRTESHGCFRLANWNAHYLAQLVWIGLPVKVE